MGWRGGERTEEEGEREWDGRGGERTEEERERESGMGGEVRGPRKRERESGMKKERERKGRIPVFIYQSFRVLLRLLQFPTTIKWVSETASCIM